MRRWLAALALGLTVPAVPALASQWDVDVGHSKLGFTVIWSREPFSASFTSWKADIQFDPADLAHARADVDVKLDSEKSDEPDFDDGLKGALGFQVSQFPEAHFATTGFVHRSGDAYVATGRLTIKGITKDILLPFTLTGDATHVRMKGTADVVRTDFGVGQGMWAAPDPVAHKVTVTIDLVATKK